MVDRRGRRVAGGVDVTVASLLGRAQDALVRRWHLCPIPPLPPVVFELRMKGATWDLLLPVRRFIAVDGALQAVGHLGPGECVGTYAGRYTYVLTGSDGVDLCVGSNVMSPGITLTAADSLAMHVPLSVTPELRIETV